MSNIIVCRSLEKSFGAQTLFSDINLVIHSGDRIGLIGPNGSGKSTLLKILCGLEESDGGEIVSGRHTTIGYLAQSDEFDDTRSLNEVMLDSLADLDLEEAERYNRVQAMLSRAEFPSGEIAVAELSGGWRKRLSVCRALLQAPDVLLLDEPTNHLDIEGILWLEKLLSGGMVDGPSSFMVVSHDRQFLEQCCTRVIELSALYPEGSFQVNGAYSDFLEKRSEYLVQQQGLEDRLANKVKRETEWLRRGPKARTSKARYRIDEAHRLQDQLQQVKDRNRADKQVRIDFDGTGRKTKKLLEARGLTKAYDQRLLFSKLDILLQPGTRLGLLGRNGCGKSTLMEILAAGEEQTQLQSGSVRTADNVNIVHFDQSRKKLNLELSLRRALAPEGDSVLFRGRSLHVVSWAKRFLFSADQLETPLSELSGGEQARILIAQLMLQPADILLLDEPTNDLDIGSLDVLEESLTSFPGALVLVTHDRFLLDRVCDQVIGFCEGGEVQYYADYMQWIREITQKKQERKKSLVQHAGKEDVKKKKIIGRLSYLDQREYDQIENRIMDAEAELEEVEVEMQDPGKAADPEHLSDCWQKVEELKALIERLYARWDELEEKKMNS